MPAVSWRPGRKGRGDPLCGCVVGAVEETAGRAPLSPQVQALHCGYVQRTAMLMLKFLKPLTLSRLSSKTPLGTLRHLHFPHFNLLY